MQASVQRASGFAPPRVNSDLQAPSTRFASHESYSATWKIIPVVRCHPASAAAPATPLHRASSRACGGSPMQCFNLSSMTHRLAFARVTLLLAATGWTAAAADAATTTAHARNLASTCTACHTRKGAGESAIAPLDGRVAADIARTMRAFRSGERAGTVMPQLARGYTDADIDAIAAWFAAQRP
jgi:sulfide dehydrogenase cytochrome subunit